MLGFYLSIVETETDKGKVEIIYDKYKKLMLHVAYRVTGDKELAEDAVHDAFLNIIKNIDRIDDPETDRTKSLVCVITRNIAINLIRKNSREMSVGLDISNIRFEGELTEEKGLSKLAIAIMNLPVGQRDVLKLKVEYGMSNKAIAKTLCISDESVRARLARAKKTLENYLKEEK